MKPSPRASRRPTDGYSAASDLAGSELVINLPDPRLLFIIARSLLLAAAVLCLPWLRSAIPSEPAVDTEWAGDELFFLPHLIQDMVSHGLLQPKGRALFLGNPGCHTDLLRENNVSFLPQGENQFTANRSLDFVFLIAGGSTDASLRFTNRVLRVGGIAAIRLGSDPIQPFNLPASYRMVYIRNFGPTILAVKKLYLDNAAGGQPARSLLSVPTKTRSDKLRNILKHLPELTGDSLVTFQRRFLAEWSSSEYERKKKKDQAKLESGNLRI
ncbi:hypothetical protein AXF42_Ash017553 [Apostasia shenzhenica]|uniref:Uncharacterized protein n=1 Tax=Apostasia shenzhenica TaxID=1088818 RepID=A0A2I0A390_9ASPA|nr:hypothetical protein AXF42_Ash017553 [Apostasia shenzhenica]